MPAQELVKLGKVVGFHGLRGEIKLRPYTNSPELFLPVKKVQIRLPDGQLIDGKLASIRLDRRMIILALAGYKSRSDVEFLQSAEIYAQKSDMAPLEEDEWWVKDLVGLSVYTTAGQPVGTVISIIDGGNQILEIAQSDATEKTILVPFVKALVPTVDIKGKRLEVVDLPGLLDAQ